MEGIPFSERAQTKAVSNLETKIREEFHEIVTGNFEVRELGITEVVPEVVFKSSPNCGRACEAKEYGAVGNRLLNLQSK